MSADQEGLNLTTTRRQTACSVDACTKEVAVQQVFWHEKANKLVAIPVCEVHYGLRDLMGERKEPDETDTTPSGDHPVQSMEGGDQA